MTNIGLEDVGGPDSEFMALLNQYEVRLRSHNELMVLYFMNKMILAFDGRNLSAL